MKFISQSGQTLIEAIVALAVIIFTVLGVFQLMSQALGATRVVNDQYIGTYLAAEGIEVIKNILDSNVQQSGWNEGLTADGAVYEVVYDDTVNTLVADSDRFLRFDSATGAYDYNGANPRTAFKRRVTVSYPDCPGVNCTDHVQVNSVAEWTTRGSANFTANLESHFFHWNQ